MNLIVLSVNYKLSPIDVLEKCACNKDSITYYLSRLIDNIHFNEMVIISTCNRTEWVFTCPESDLAIDYLLNEIQQKSNVAKSILKNASEIYKNDHAIQHLFEVVSGLKSMVLGENEILSQVRENYQVCLEFGATSAYLNKLFQSVIALGKEVRTVTNISKGAHSISSIAIEAIKHQDPNFIQKPILLIGAGVMIHRALVKLVAMNHQNIWLANRTMSRAEKLANNFDNINVIPYASITKQLSKFSTIYIGINSPSYLFLPTHFQFLHSKKIIVDVSIPRNIHMDCKQFDHLNIITIDQLESIAKRTLNSRRLDIPSVQLCIKKAHGEFNNWLNYRKNVKQWSKLASA